MATKKPENQIHNYALSLLAWAVQQPINGGTDCYQVAAFDDEQDAKEHAERLNERFGPDLPYVVSYIGTRYENLDQK